MGQKGLGCATAVALGVALALGTFRASAGEPSLAPSTQVLPDGRTVKVVKCYPDGRMRAYCVSFDDGTLGSDWPVLEALRQRGLPATFFVNSAHPQSKDAVKYPQRYAGFEIASHGANHRGLGGLKLEDARQEIVSDQKVLGEKFGQKIEGFAYPYGDLPKDPQALADLEQMLRTEGLLYARCTGATNAFAPPADFIRWVPDCGFLHDLGKYRALPADDSVRVLMSFAHSIDFARGLMSFEKWEKQLDDLAADSQIWKATMLDYVRYIEALRRIEFSSAGITNSSDFTVWVKVDGQAVEVPKGISPWPVGI